MKTIIGLALIIVCLLGFNNQVSEATPISRGPESRCNNVCPRLWSPVCGLNGEQLRLFVNKCEMKSINCWEDTDFDEVKPTLCDDKAKERPDCESCYYIWSPVCGSDGGERKTFSSKCAMDFENCLQGTSFVQLKDGICSETEDIVEKPDRSCKPCTRNYDPVCGSDADDIRTFPNQCEMESFNCRESRNFLLMRDGTC